MTTTQTGFRVLAPRQSHGFTPEALAHRDLSPGGLPSGTHFIALLGAFRATGGTAPGDVVSRLLEEHRSVDSVSLAQLIHTGLVFGLEWRGSLWIPMFQFDPDTLAVAAGAQEVRVALPTLWSGWQVADWFACPNVLLDRQRPVDALAARLPAVVDAALAQRSEGLRSIA